MLARFLRAPYNTPEICAQQGSQIKCRGDVAQLGERLVRNEEVGGSTPLVSTNAKKSNDLPRRRPTSFPAWPGC